MVDSLQRSDSEPPNPFIQIERSLSGDRVDVDTAIQALLLLANEAGIVRMTTLEAGHLHVEVGDCGFAQVNVDRAKMKIRMVCARLAVLCKEQGAQDLSPYGGRGSLSHSGFDHPFDLDFANTMHEQSILLATHT